MITKERIGKIQFYFGILLLVATIIGSIFIIKYVYIGAVITGAGITGVWGEVSQGTNGTLIGISGHLVSNLMLQAQVIKTTMFLYGTCALVLIVLSIILILQGLVNQLKK
ncbi:hypothetical protein HN419_02265 [Candidatus Woesearchaeota archaeon]|jgi:hypothetical protein|nr:hypothetical protein [Candidatus Woesearchaeota archaeon]MBT3537178.1 hypothetical protein [Candidatus Woesearchaeota archaeon]MBT4696676.1 hypothetical protein [Candidatus Woesearchaeota archaeon]MBT4717208.1 hypothetical protein [Candidatus Woesearchaeota archaeon]MBT7106512.1 hypothetical protein [Candidatus Woesearchaeota archaeon]